MKHVNWKRWSWVAIAGVGTVTFIALAGPLDPPAGPVESTGPIILNEQWTTLPIVIDDPGSYILTSDLVGTSGQHGITITAPDVTIDLNGFSIIGVEGSVRGINVGGGGDRFCVRNGSIRDWGTLGIYAENVIGFVIDSVQVTGSGDWGIKVGNESSPLGSGVVRDCTATDNAYGIYAFRSSVTSCTASYNSGLGFAVRYGQIADSAANGNGSAGFWAREGTSITSCASTYNSGDGFNIQSGCALSQSTAHDNNGYGVNSVNCLIHANAITSNNAGNINASGCTVELNHVL